MIRPHVADLEMISDDELRHRRLLQRHVQEWSKCFMQKRNVFYLLKVAWGRPEIRNRRYIHFDFLLYLSSTGGTPILVRALHMDWWWTPTLNRFTKRSTPSYRTKHRSPMTNSKPKKMHLALLSTLVSSERVESRETRRRSRREAEVKRDRATSGWQNG